MSLIYIWIIPNHYSMLDNGKLMALNGGIGIEKNIWYPRESYHKHVFGRSNTEHLASRQNLRIHFQWQYDYAAGFKVLLYCNSWLARNRQQIPLVGEPPQPGAKDIVDETVRQNQKVVGIPSRNVSLKLVSKQLLVGSYGPGMIHVFQWKQYL